MMKNFAAILLIVIAGCSASELSPDFSAHWTGDPTTGNAWRFVLEENIKGKLQQKGLVQCYESDPEKFIAKILISTWTADKAYWYIENRPIKFIDPQNVSGQAQGCIYEKIKFKNPSRKATYYMLWSAIDPGATDQAMQRVQENFLKNIYKN